MKKLLCGILCASAGAALAVESTVATIEVRAINSGMTNTIVAIPGLDLTGGALVVSNLVKTTNLTAGDELMAFDNGTYRTWALDANKHWQATTSFNKGQDGVDTVVPGTPASQFEMGVGSGIWLSRKVSGVSSPFYVYALQPAAMTSTIAASTTALVGNPTSVDKAFVSCTGCSDGDKIYVPTATGNGRAEYTFKNNAWGRLVVNEGVISREVTTPVIKAGTGFWYKSGSSAVTLNW